MKWLDAWRERRDRAWWDKWHREHRWDDLGRYNSEMAHGLVHSEEFRARMALEQSAFDEAHGHDVLRGML